MDFWVGIALLTGITKGLSCHPIQCGCVLSSCSDH